MDGIAHHRIKELLSMKAKESNRMTKIIGRRSITLAAVLALALGGASLQAGTPNSWFMGLGAYNGGVGIGVLPGMHDGWDGQTAADPYWLPYVDVGLMLYRANGPGWAGETGFYSEDSGSPIPAGTTKTWSGFYLWEHNYTPNPPGQIEVRNGFEAGVDEGPPAGYRGHLVIEQVPTGLTWTGPMDYWFDMTQFNTFIMPIAQVDDPLQGTRFSLTVYAPPVPEPSSLAALALGAIPLSGLLRRRRR
jgi:hypothetical protein